LCSIHFIDAKLEDGIPGMRENLTRSPPSVPTENEHASCSRNVEDLPYTATITDNILGAANTVWRSHRDCLIYGSEDDIAYFVRRYLEDILVALKLPLNFSSEVTIKQIRPDICVLLAGMYLVGVVEVKKPGGNVLLKPTVLGELLDQMLLVEGFYGMGPVIGILTTAEEWIVSWFPIDSATLVQLEVEKQSTAPLSTPLKSASNATSEAEDNSPPGSTPSQRSGTVHTLDIAGEISSGHGDDNTEPSQHMERVLCTTDVVNIYKDPKRVLKLLCSAFQVMAKSNLHHRPKLSRCLLKFHKGIQTVTFHPVSHDEMHAEVDFDKFPNMNVKTLVALEDLGTGSTGRAWLCVTVTKKAVCVLKFDNKHANSNNLANEKEMWLVLYPEFSLMIKVELWSGADALVMPHFSTVLVSERKVYTDEVFAALTKIQAKGKVHRDVRWRNIGKYKSGGSVVIVVYDLHDVVNYDDDAHSAWISDAMTALYND
jgi:hypothetical protein